MDSYKDVFYAAGLPALISTGITLVYFLLKVYQFAVHAVSHETEGRLAVATPGGRKQEHSVKVCPWCGVGLLRLLFLYCGIINKLTLLLVLAAPVKRKGARGEVRFPETPLLCALFYLKGPAPCCYWLAVTCLSYVLCLSLKAVLSHLVTVL